MRLLAVAALCAVLGGCGTTAAVIGHCELPEKLATKEPALTDLDTTKPTPRDQSDQQWARDRAQGAKAIAHANATIDYVGAKCQ